MTPASLSLLFAEEDCLDFCLDELLNNCDIFMIFLTCTLWRVFFLPWQVSHGTADLPSLNPSDDDVANNDQYYTDESYTLDDEPPLDDYFLTSLALLLIFSHALGFSCFFVKNISIIVTRELLEKFKFNVFGIER